MRFPVLILAAAVTASACGRGYDMVSPPTVEAAFRLTPSEVSFENRRTEERGAATFVCGDLRVLWSIEALSGIGGQVTRGQSTVTEGDGGTQPAVSAALDVTVAKTGSTTVRTERAFCGQRGVDFPARFDWQLTMRDDSGTAYGFFHPTTLADF